MLNVKQTIMDPVVEIESGRISGVVENHEEGFEYYAFRGIPYAEPPLGDLRFQDPIQIKPWNSVLDCKTYAPECFQFNVFTKEKIYNENCLHLNVFTRSINQPNARTAVLVWIHGGEFSFGDANDTFLGPDYLIRKDIVLVTINFRLGVIGFLDLEDKVAPGNQGFKDQVMALKWVQQNIKVFGGDANNVTIGGTSCGAVSAHYLSLSPLAKDLVHKAICHGSSAYNSWSAVINPRENAIKLCSMLGKELSDPTEIVKFLKTVSSEQLLEAQNRLRLSMDCLSFGPGVDSQSSNPFMPIHPSTAADQGVHIPYLIGYTSHEGILMALGMSIKDLCKLCDSDFGQLFRYNIKQILQRYGLTIEQIRKFYYKSESVSESNLDKFVELTSDFYFIESVHKLARVQSEQSSAPTYLFQFSYDSPNAISKFVIKNMPTGACHLDDLTFLFKMRLFERIGQSYYRRGSDDYKIMERMTELWTNFAKYGRPTIETSELLPVHWKPLSDGTLLRYLDIDEDITMKYTVNVDQKLLSARDIKA